MAKKEINKIKIKSTGETYLVKPDGYDALYNAVLALCDIYGISKPSWRPPVEENDNSTGGNDPGTGSNTGGNDPGTGSNTGGNDPGTGSNTGGDDPGTGGSTGGDDPGTGGNAGGDVNVTPFTLTYNILPISARSRATYKWYSNEAMTDEYEIENTNEEKNTLTLTTNIYEYVWCKVSASGYEDCWNRFDSWKLEDDEITISLYKL